MAHTENRPTTYIAFLRGINVGAHNRMKMEELRELCRSLGLENVQTYIQSGNVAFGAAEANGDALGDELEAAIEDSFGYDISVMVRTRAELDEVVARQPFEEPSDENTKRYVTFLGEEPGDERIQALLAAQNEAEEFAVNGPTVYSRVDGDELENGRFTDAGKILDVPATRRTWNVVEKVLELGSS